MQGYTYLYGVKASNVPLCSRRCLRSLNTPNFYTPWTEAVDCLHYTGQEVISIPYSEVNLRCRERDRDSNTRGATASWTYVLLHYVLYCTIIRKRVHRTIDD